MPIFEIECSDCDYTGEVLVMDKDGKTVCPSCGGRRTNRLMSATSSLTGRDGKPMPGPRDTACCGSKPGTPSGCAGPGSCCGQKPF